MTETLISHRLWFLSKIYEFALGRVQMVWSTSKAVGCAVHRCSRLGGLPWTRPAYFVVCNYNPSGNWKGQRPYQYGRQCSRCPSDAPHCVNGLCSATPAASRQRAPPQPQRRVAPVAQLRREYSVETSRQGQPRPSQPRPSQPRPSQPRPSQPRPSQPRPSQPRRDDTSARIAQLESRLQSALSRRTADVQAKMAQLERKLTGKD